MFEFYECLYARRDALFALTDAVLCADGPVKTLVELSLAIEHQRGCGALYTALDRGWLELAALGCGLTSWVALLDAVRAEPVAHVHGRHEPAAAALGKGSGASALAPRTTPHG